MVSLGLCILFGCLGCVSTDLTGAPAIAPSTVPPLGPPGLKACVIVAEFVDKTSNFREFRAEIGRGPADMLITSLVQTGRYVVLERDQWRPLELERGRPLTPGCPGKTGLLVTAAITGFDPGVGERVISPGDICQVPGRGKPWNRACQWAGLFPALASRTCAVAVDLRVIDLASTQVIAATGVRGKATSGRVLLPGLDLAGKPPLEGAMRDMLTKIMTFLNAQIPAHYFQYAG
jgi:curli biogenesis system outer membrane secretion channel CsgG